KLDFKVLPSGEVIVPEPYRDELGALLKPDGTLHQHNAGQRDRLYRNEGGKFVDTEESAGIRGHSEGLSASWWDYNEDGWIDLYVSNDFFGPDHLYRNNKDGSFTDVIAETVPHTPWFSMGSDAGDLNGDGRLDFIASDMAATTHYKQKMNMGDMDAEGWFLEKPTPRQYMRNAVYLNTGTPRFLEVAQMAGLASTDWTWAVKIADFDSDGRNDVFVSNGMTRDFFNSDIRSKVREVHEKTGVNTWIEYPPLKERNRFFHNRGEMVFEDVSEDWGLLEDTTSFGAAAGDLDGDGDLDLVVNNFEESPGLFRNTSAGGQVMVIALQGSGLNQDGIGAELRATTRSGTLVRTLQPMRGYLGCDPAEAVFGLGEADSVDALTIRWPSGVVQTVSDLAAGYRYVIGEVGGTPAKPAPAKVPLFGALPTPATHAERSFDDFAIQPLLPNKLSLEGPAMAWGDIDGNGRQDFFLGGGAGSAGQLWIQPGERNLKRVQQDVFEAASDSEDVAAVFFDAEGDGDPDLYVVSGGVESEQGAAALQDRLYLNHEGKFTPAIEGSLPDLRFSGSCVAPGDLDGDGDLDLFVGARVIPGKYPTSDRSRLLLNTGAAHFTDAGVELAPALDAAGMVTDALWSDVDGDGDADLLVTTEYGPVKLYRNQGGKLEDATTEAGLAARLGWWNCIAAADVDGDGDSDYAVGNFGLNTKYHPTSEEPQLLFFGDFEGTGTKHIVEAHRTGETVVPNRGRSCSSAAMPFIREKFGTFHDFAVADLVGIYTKPKLEQSLQLEANELRSGILLNDGNGKFQFRPLPWLAQVAPCFGLAFLQADSDGKPDLYVSQNFYGPQRETGRMAGGLGALLMGMGDGTFREIWPAESGIVVPGDAREAAAVDVDGDGQDDLAVAVNNGNLQVFLNRVPK
ncbi:MAG: VCBS repeat-containing protein, partial [Verrucomicrobiales bacterium]